MSKKLVIGNLFKQIGYYLFGNNMFEQIRLPNTNLLGHMQMSMRNGVTVYGHFGTKTLRHQDTLAPVPKCRVNGGIVT